jgi:phospholipid/cholesterol/gamma-HCH transport system permease protein
LPAETANADCESAARRITLRGDWATTEALPDVRELLSAIDANPGLWTVDLHAVSASDARLDASLLRLARAAQAQGEFRLEGVDPARQRLLDLALAVSPAPASSDTGAPLLSLKRLRGFLQDVGDDFLDSLAFLGDLILAFGRVISGRSAMRLRELMSASYQAGPNALGIIVLTSTLVGMILAYLGAAQLQQFGAAIYVADLVAIGMLREMGALMTAVVMSGRTGAAYAAQLSTMQTNEEIDAIRTLGIDPMEYLVIPRVIGLVVMMPLLVIFANALGILGGAIVAGGMGVTPLQYLNQLGVSLSLTHFGVGMVKALIFALLIAIAGCRAGMSSGRSSAAVGQATTEAVVTSVIYLIIADAAINILCQQMGI